MSDLFQNTQVPLYILLLGRFQAISWAVGLLCMFGQKYYCIAHKRITMVLHTSYYPISFYYCYLYEADFHSSFF